VGREQYGTHADNVFAAIAEGLTPRYAITSCTDEWDRFEGLYATAVERYVAAHPDDRDAPAMKARITRWREIAPARRCNRSATGSSSVFSHPPPLGTIPPADRGRLAPSTRRGP
jgi:hypothetical protein